MQKILISLLIVTNLLVVASHLWMMRSHDQSLHEISRQVQSIQKASVSSRTARLAPFSGGSIGAQAGASLQQLEATTAKTYETLSAEAKKSAQEFEAKAAPAIQEMSEELEKSAEELKAAAAPAIEAASEKAATMSKEIQTAAENLRESFSQELEKFNQAMKSKQAGSQT